MSEKAIFAFPEMQSVAELPYEMLKQSKMILNPKGEPLKSRPVQSWDLICDVEENIRKSGLKYEMAPIYVQKSGSHQVVTREEKGMFTESNTPIDRWLFDKLITEIKLPDFSNVDGTSTIAISFNDRGIQIAWGFNVRICSNLSIFSGNNSIRTYGDDKRNYSDVLLNLNNYLSKAEELARMDMRIMDRMKEIKLSGKKALNEVIGTLYRSAVRQSYVDSKEQAPFNITTMSKLTQNIENNYQKLREDSSVWNLYNFGTDMIKPANVDITNIVDNNRSWGEFMVNHFGINRN
jgi:hypothetical protein